MERWKSIIGWWTRALGDGTGLSLSRRPAEPTRAGQREAEIEAELVQHLVRQAPTGFAIGTLTVAAIVLVLWSAAPRSLLLVWLVSMGLLSFPAFVVVWRYMRAEPVAARMPSWRRALAVVYGLAGTGWGVASVLLYPRMAMPYQLFLLLVLAGAGIRGMAALAPVPGACIAYLTGTYVPIAGYLLADGSFSSVATGLLLLAFSGSLIALGFEVRALLVRSLKLRFENVELIDHLSRAKDAAEAASRTKSVFLANVSHELRTPLSLMLGPIRRLLTSGTAGSEARPDLQTVERNAQALLRRVIDLLEVAKLEAGRMELERSPLDMVEVVRRTASLFEVAARERDVELAIETPPALSIVGDPEKLERVLLNLLSNAMKFVPDGGRVRVGLSVEGGEVVLSVEDNGPGVPFHLRDAIFERFRRGDDQTTQRFGGTGLGLAIAKELVELHGGRIHVADGPDGGAVFRVTLPLASELAHGAPAVAVPMDAGARDTLDEVARQTVSEVRLRGVPPAAIRGSGDQGLVLVVEDNPDMNRFLVDCLGAAYQVETAFDGREGLAKALELRPDLILTDVMMPMGGDEFVRDLRAHPELGGIPIVVLTAKADDELRVKLLRDGAQDFLTKPVISEELLARVANCVTLKRTRDVLESALSRQGRDLATLADDLAAANRAKDEFLAILSHELRTPLMPIVGWSFLLRRGQLDAAATVRALDAIDRSAKLQVSIVDDLLDVSRAISGKLRLNARPIDPGPVIQAAVDAVAPTATAKGVLLETAVDSECGVVSGDPERLQQVVRNLLSNAIKFTPCGGRVDVRLMRVGDDVQLTVRDTGCGIKPALLPRLFERFWQADSSSTRTQGGLGLGLAIVRHLVDLHGGSVRAESEGEGKGTTFTVALPVLPLEHAVEDVPSSQPIDVRFPGLRALVVDDDRDTCEMVGAVLRKAGADVRTCFSANDALTVMDSWVPDILLSDVAMPEDDGYTLIRKVRARTRAEGRDVVAVALTAYARSEDRMKALSAGFHVHVAKPIEPTQLVNVVATVTGHGARPDL
jgi:signal transduction histidine kinase